MSDQLTPDAWAGQLTQELAEARAECDRLRAERDRVGEALTKAQVRSNANAAAGRELAEAVEAFWAEHESGQGRYTAVRERLREALARFRETTNP